PQSSAISLRGELVESISRLARSRRRFATYCSGDSPKLVRNTRLKWHGVSRTTVARSALRIGLSSAVSTCEATLRICQGANPPLTTLRVGRDSSVVCSNSAARLKHLWAESRSSLSALFRATTSSSTIDRSCRTVDEESRRAASALASALMAPDQSV